LEGLSKRTRPKQKIVLAINKIDMVKAEKLLALTQKINEMFEFEETFMISAEKGFGVKELRAYCGANMPKGPWLYPEDQIADVPMRMIAAETTREKLMLRLHQELPYFLTVETTGWEQRKDGTVRIDQVVYVIRERHKGIALGPKGSTMKAVSIASRTELKNLVGSEVHLFIQVKVRPKWENEAERFEEMGLDFSDTKK
jgi:GTP-binding protein Era